MHVGSGTVYSNLHAGNVAGKCEASLICTVACPK